MRQRAANDAALGFQRLKWALDPVAFAREVLGFVADPMQAAFLRSAARQILLLCTRQWGKSTTTAVLAVHMALFKPKSLILLTSPGDRQSGLLFEKVRAFLDLCPGAFSVEDDDSSTEDKKRSCKLGNGSRVVALPQNPAKIRGYSAPDLIIEDEASEVEDAQYEAVRPMRITVPNSRLILMGTPKGKRGHFYEAWANGGADWQRFQVKATDCPRITAESIEKERRARGNAYVSQEFMCEFNDALNSVFTHEQITNAMVEFDGPMMVV